MSGEDGAPKRAMEPAQSVSGELTADRRGARRVPVSLKVVEVDGTTTYFQYATNLSAGGLFLDGTLGAEPGTEVTLIFVPPGMHEPVQVPARVVRYREGERSGAHLQFLDPEDSLLREHLRSYVSSRDS